MRRETFSLSNLISIPFNLQDICWHVRGSPPRRSVRSKQNRPRPVSTRTIQLHQSVYHPILQCLDTQSVVYHKIRYACSELARYMTSASTSRANNGTGSVDTPGRKRRRAAVAESVSPLNTCSEYRPTRPALSPRRGLVCRPASGI
jgi:hypothetical protein